MIGPICSSQSLIFGVFLLSGLLGLKQNKVDRYLFPLNRVRENGVAGNRLFKSACSSIDESEFHGIFPYEYYEYQVHYLYQGGPFVLFSHFHFISGSGAEI